MRKVKEKYDVIVVGGGPAGSVSAKLLSEKGFTVALINQSKKDKYICGESLPPQVNPVIKRLGLLSLMESSKHLSTTGNLSAFGSSQIDVQDYVFSPYGQGWHLDRREFDSDLLNLCQSKGVVIYQDFKVGNIELDKNLWRFFSKNSSAEEIILNSDYLVDATGKRARVLKQLSINTNKYNRLACRCVIYPSQYQSDTRTLIESSENGWWYSAAIPNKRQVLMYFSDADLPEYQLMKMGPRFNQNLQLTQHIKHTINKKDLDFEPNVFSFNAQVTQAQKVSGENWFAVGDAAISYDPLSSQGIWKALLGAEIVCQNIVNNSNAQNQNYSQWVNEQAQEFWSLHQQFYAQEQRWRHNEFWQRRHNSL